MPTWNTKYKNLKKEKLFSTKMTNPNIPPSRQAVPNWKFNPNEIPKDQLRAFYNLHYEIFVKMNNYFKVEDPENPTYEELYGYWNKYQQFHCDYIYPITGTNFDYTIFDRVSYLNDLFVSTEKKTVVLFFWSTSCGFSIPTMIDVSKMLPVNAQLVSVNIDKGIFRVLAEKGHQHSFNLENIKAKLEGAPKDIPHIVDFDDRFHDIYHIKAPCCRLIPALLVVENAKVTYMGQVESWKGLVAN
ncbi:hypothetical protein HDV06_003229 [Boothiomyces sp. JEL0866]|nr:hypothetical protein HDV06_003229 [Boothiomyces sp. JEL0866]